MRSGDRPGLQNRRVAGNPVTGGFDPHSLPPILWLDSHAELVKGTEGALSLMAGGSCCGRGHRDGAGGFSNNQLGFHFVVNGTPGSVLAMRANSLQQNF
jgi:hypothetical protein